MNLHSLASLHTPMILHVGRGRGLRGLGETSNLALGRPASQSSQATIDTSATAAKAVDGNRDGNFANRSVSHTENDINSWWQVDLGQINNIDRVDIWNRTDCCSERLKNFFLLISDVPFISTDLNVVSQQAGIGKVYVAGPVGAMTTIPVGRTGRFVRIQLNYKEYLHLAEVEVYGSPVAASTSTQVETSTGATVATPAASSSSFVDNLSSSFSNLFSSPDYSGADVGTAVAAGGGFFSKSFDVFGFSIPYYVPLLAIGAFLALKKKHR